MAEAEGVKCESKEEVKKVEEEGPKEKTLNTRRWCSVPLCKSRKYRSLHKFPRDPELRKKWVIACRIGKKLTPNMLVCRDHFLPSDFIPRWDGRLRNLKRIAIPSQNLPTRPLDKILSPSQLKRKDDRAMRAAKRLERVVPRILKTSSQNKPLEENKSSKKTEVKDVKVAKAGDSIEHSQPNVNYTVEEVYEKLEVSTGRVDMDVANLEAYIPNPVCMCNRSKKIVQENKECFEIRAARVLLEFNVIVEELMKSREIIFPTKDVVLKKVEEFYQCARRSHKVAFFTLFKKDIQLHTFTGIDFKLMDILTKSVSGCEELDSLETELSIKEKILLTLIKLRWNPSYGTLANLFHISESNCTSVFHNIIQVLKSILKSAIYWPTQEEIMNHMPESLETLKKTIAVISHNEINLKRLMCSECDLPMALDYDGIDKLKISLGFSQCGLITYVSKAEQSVTSIDETIVDPNSISKILIPSNDAIMTDGCFIEQDCNRLFIELIKSRTEKPLDLEFGKTEKPKETALIHVDSAYKRFRKFRFLQSSVSSNEASLIDDISVIISGIINLGNSVIVKSFNDFSSLKKR
ncbi:uncharacterized protein LOC100678589 isoform X1 [Nasonia vitripennis]|uniref:THAP-type domain-containing protein n=1 Tax=Nasonia vitripennis TaxID=7425 RepID=A0A7M7GMM3_NASVI|nr:uncharacterized protein LOC100678589 isoform X1 [Nasonia vitripennis]